jgi:hypothetical protein
VEHEIGEPPFRVTSAPVRQLARRPPRGSRRAELMVTCLTTRPHWLLASLFRFQGATTRHRDTWATPEGCATVPRAPSRHSPLPPPLPLWAGPARSVRVNPPGNGSPGGLEMLPGWSPELQAGTGISSVEPRKPPSH